MSGNQINQSVSIIDRPSLIVIILMACFSFWFADFWKPINEATFQQQQEIFERYVYLPSFFFNHQSFDWSKSLGLSLNFQYENASHFNYGSALLYFPFFLIAMLINHLNAIDQGNGFSDIFLNAIHWSAIVYALFGLIFLRKFLLNYFSEWVVAITLFTTFFGTTLFYYTFIRSELPEIQLFFLFSAFLYFIKKWHDEPKLIWLIICICITSLISLIRFFDVYVVFFFILWNVKNLEDLKIKLKFFQANFKSLILVLAAFVLFWLPQLFLDYKISGYVFFTPNINRAYDLTDSRIGHVFTSFQNGWLIYSPIIIIALLGLLFMPRKFSFSALSILSVLLFVVVFYGASWDWRHDAYFGARRLSAFVVWLSMPFAFFIERLFSKQKISYSVVSLKLFFLAFVFSCFCLNISQSYMVLTNKIQPNKMNEKKYWQTFRNFKF